MSKDVDLQKVENEQHAVEGTTELSVNVACADRNDEKYSCLQLMPMEELVPLSQTLITPTLARLFNLDTQPGPPPQRCANTTASITERLHPHYHVELQRMQQLQEDDMLRSAEEDDHTKHNAGDPCRIHMVMRGPLLQEGKGGTAMAGFKRSQANARLSDGYALQPSDADAAEDHAEVFGMNQLVERENSSNSGDGGAGSGGGGGGSSGARTLKRPRLVWTPQLHKRFVDAVSHLGIKNAVPKTIMQLMNVEGLTRENVASHLQKYRLYLRRVQQGNLFSSCSNSPTSKTSILGGLDHPHHPSLIGAPMSPPAAHSDNLFNSSDTRPISNSMASSNNHHSHAHPLSRLPGHASHLLPQHIPSLLLQPMPHQLNQPMAVVKSPPQFNITQHLDPRRYATNRINSAPIKKASWPPPNANLVDINAMHHAENHVAAAASSPPRRALTLFPH